MLRALPRFVWLSALTSAVACGSSGSPAPAAPAPDGGDAATESADPPDVVRFPKGFLWGSATAAFQIEKGDAHTDWAHWVQMVGTIKNGDSPDNGGPDALAHVDDDVRALADSGQNAYRFSLEWGRIYPTRAAFDADTPDAAALAAYDGLISKLHDAHITPLVTLHHFAFPDWLSDVSAPAQPQGWERPEASDLFTEFCRRMAARYKDKVDWWVTINEPLVMALQGYLQGGSPPGVALDTTRTFAVSKDEARAHAKAYDAIHAADTADADGDGKAAMVSVAAHLRTFHAADAANPDDAAAAEHVRYVWNTWFLQAIVRGDWDDDIDGKLDGPDDRRGDPALAARADYLGINYYSDTLVSAHDGFVIPVVNAAVTFDHMPTSRPKTDVAWDIYPEGFRTVIEEMKPFGLPVIVTENGIADAADRNRARFLAEHAYQMGLAIKGGADVRGYFTWSLMDNFEWASGFCPKFGLYAVDPVTGARTARGSVATYRSIARSGRLSPADIAPLPAYAPGSLCP